MPLGLREEVLADRHPALQAVGLFVLHGAGGQWPEGSARPGLASQPPPQERPPRDIFRWAVNASAPRDSPSGTFDWLPAAVMPPGASRIGRVTEGGAVTTNERAKSVTGTGSCESSTVATS